MKAVMGMRADSGEELLRRMAARRRRDNIVFAVLAALAVLGGGATILGWMLPERSAAQVDSTTVVISHAQLAGSFATEFVVTYLTSVDGQKDRIGRYLDMGRQIDLPKTRQQVSDPAVVHVRRSADAGRLEVWAVTVSVQVSDGTARQYYGVAVALIDGRLRALAPPTLVGAPETGPDLVTVYSQAPCGPESPLVAAVSGFLGAFLAGSGELGRYTTMDSGIVALAPPPFTALESVSVSADDDGCGSSRSTVRVLAVVRPLGRDGGGATLAYPLTLVRAEGQQWQVRSMDIVPALSDPIAVVAAGQPGAAISSTTPSVTVTIPPATHN